MPMDDNVRTEKRLINKLSEVCACIAEQEKQAITTTKDESMSNESGMHSDFLYEPFSLPHSQYTKPLSL